MVLTAREIWTALHGMVFGAGYLLAFTAGLVGLYSLRESWVTGVGIMERVVRLKWEVAAMAVLSFLTVFSGTYIVYPWYRAAPPEGADLLEYPRSFLLANPNLAGWHTFGMEWKEHIAWFSPILTIAVLYLIFKYGPSLAQEKNKNLRWMIVVLFILSFAAAGVAGLFGALITKAAPIL